MHSSHPIHRALVTFSNATTGEVRVKIPTILGIDSEVALSYIGRKTPWVVPTVGDQIVVTSDDANLTNVFWVQTDRGLDGANGRDGRDGKDGRDGVDGVDGVGVRDAKIDFDGSLVISLTDGREINCGEVVSVDVAKQIA